MKISTGRSVLIEALGIMISMLVADPEIYESHVGVYFDRDDR